MKILLMLMLQQLEAILEEMAKFAQNVTLPLNRTGDEEGANI